jgi:DNA-binding PadR family transcriptional regulator
MPNEASPHAPENSAFAQRRHWSLAVLCLLYERAMHPYEMRRVMKQRHKDDRLILKPGSLYNAVIWLQEQGFIEASEINRVGRRPQRTVFRLSPAGEAQLAIWLGGMLTEIRKDVSSFSVALDHLVYISSREAQTFLDERRANLEISIRELEEAVAVLTDRVGRINVIELEYDLAVFRAQYTWLERTLEELRSGKLRWSTSAVINAARKAAADARPVKKLSVPSPK